MSQMVFCTLCIWYSSRVWSLEESWFMSLSELGSIWGCQVNGFTPYNLIFYEYRMCWWLMLYSDFTLTIYCMCNIVSFAIWDRVVGLVLIGDWADFVMQIWQDIQAETYSSDIDVTVTHKKSKWRGKYFFKCRPKTDYIYMCLLDSKMGLLTTTAHNNHIAYVCYGNIFCTWKLTKFTVNSIL